LKLLQKTNQIYLLISGTAFIVAGAIIYFALSIVFNDQLNEKLKSDIELVRNTLKTKGTLTVYSPFVESKEVQDHPVRSYMVSDTLIFDKNEMESVPFRQVSVIDSINGKKYLIVSRDTLLERGDLLSTIIIVTGTVFIILLIIVYFIYRKLSLKIWKPFYKTLDNLKKFSYDKPDFRLSSESALDEFTELNDALEKLTQKVITDYHSLKRFSEDASHEIQTPVSIILTNIESLLQYPGLNPVQTDLVKSVYANAIRISKLTQTLLLLTKIANDQFPERTSVDFHDLIEVKLNLFEDHIRMKSLKILKNTSLECMHETNYFLAESLVNNLIGNAVKHSNEGGAVNILLDMNLFEISNTGEPLSVPVSKLFERFYKTDRSVGSYGLGLSIVQEICNINHWKIDYKYEDSLHKVTVHF
jgi:signal transduction histidine kinase